jgi:hypothetical protein
MPVPSLHSYATVCQSSAVSSRAAGRDQPWRSRETGALSIEPGPKNGWNHDSGKLNWTTGRPDAVFWDTYGDHRHRPHRHRVYG